MPSTNEYDINMKGYLQEGEEVGRGSWEAQEGMAQQHPGGDQDEVGDRVGEGQGEVLPLHRGEGREDRWEGSEVEEHQVAVVEEEHRPVMREVWMVQHH